MQGLSNNYENKIRKDYLDMNLEIVKDNNVLL